jgi:hypothetical protein
MNCDYFQVIGILDIKEENLKEKIKMPILYKKWTHPEIAMIMDKPSDIGVTDKILSKILGRTIAAIRNKRYKLLKEN